MNKYGIWLLAPLMLGACDNNVPTKPVVGSGQNQQHSAELQNLIHQVVDGGFGAIYSPEKDSALHPKG